jgi:hypothetical protein
MRIFKSPLAWIPFLLLASLSGPASCAYYESTSLASNPTRVYTYSEGQYQLYGDGTEPNPYFWVWIPSGAGSVPAPPPAPTLAVGKLGQTELTYAEGRYEIRGNGTVTNPYYWVWVPAGTLVGRASEPAPPPVPGTANAQFVQQVYIYPEGQYEIHGGGTAASPYYWVWIPAGVASLPAPPPAPGGGQRVYTYPQGRFELFGDGTAGNPYYWAWIPAGPTAATVVSVPPPVPGSVSGQLMKRVYAYPEGQYELHGDGTAARPYYWVWIPAGATAAASVPAPPPAPSVGQFLQRVYTYRQGRYELQGDGTAENPYFWAWIPAGAQTVYFPPQPPLPPQS